MERLDTKQDLLRVEPGFALLEAPLDLQVLAEVAPGAVIRDEEQVLTRLERIPQLNDERVLAHGAHHIALRYRILL